MFHKSRHDQGQRHARDEWPAAATASAATSTSAAGAAGCSTRAICASSCSASSPRSRATATRLIKEIEDRLGGAYSPSPGVIYPTLTLLEEMGQTSVTASEGGKKLYAITPEGEAALAANKATVDAIFARIAEVSAAHGGGPAPQILRAMQNLRLALRMRLARGPLSEAEIDAITQALDAAAVTVERS